MVISEIYLLFQVIYLTLLFYYLLIHFNYHWINLKKLANFLIKMKCSFILHYFLYNFKKMIIFRF